MFSCLSISSVKSRNRSLRVQPVRDIVLPIRTDTITVYTTAISFNSITNSESRYIIISPSHN